MRTVKMEYVISMRGLEGKRDEEKHVNGRARREERWRKTCQWEDWKGKGEGKDQMRQC